MALLGTFGPDEHPGEVNVDQFSAFMDRLHGDVADLSFLYEGEVRFIGPPNILRKMTPDDLGSQFQYNFAYRSDGATVIEGFLKSLGANQRLKYQRTTFLKNVMESSEFYPDLPMPSRPERVVNTNLNMIVSKNIPTFLFLWVFQITKPLQAYGYSFRGWEEIDGHRCLHVGLHRMPVAVAPNSQVIDLWIDLGRGGHPLRVETRDGGNLNERIDNIRLIEVVAKDGKKVWVPFTSETSTFGWSGRYYSKPILHETTTMVEGSLTVNASLHDSVFDIRGPSRLPKTPILDGYRRRFDEIAAKHVVKTDPKSVTARLDESLRLAESQAAELVASKPAEATSGFVTLLQVVIAAVSLIAVIGAFVLRSRGG